MKIRQLEKEGPLTIVTAGHDSLRKIARPLAVEEIGSSEVQKFIEDITKTLKNSGYGAALAANQVDKLWRIVVIGLKDPYEVLINPVISKISKETEIGFEGCLSIPGYLGAVERYQKIVVDAYNPKGEKIKIKASGFRSRVIQHEIDHLDGILYYDRMKDMTTFMTEEEFKKRFKKEEDLDDQEQDL